MVLPVVEPPTPNHGSKRADWAQKPHGASTCPERGDVRFGVPFAN